MSMHSEGSDAVRERDAGSLPRCRALTANNSASAFEGVWRTVEVVVAGADASDIQTRCDAGHLSREALQPGRSACRRCAAGVEGSGGSICGRTARGVGSLRRRGRHVRAEWQQCRHDAGDGGEESRRHDERRDERLHLSAKRRHADTDAGSHALGSECAPVTIKLARVE